MSGFGHLNGNLDANSAKSVNSAYNFDSANKATVVCNDPTALLSSTGLSHVDLFILDCEGCELSVLNSLNFSVVEVDVFLIEANHPVEVFYLMTARGYELVACIGAEDLVFARKNSTPLQKWLKSTTNESGRIEEKEYCFHRYSIQ